VFPIFNKLSFNKTKFNILTITSSNQQYNETNKSEILSTSQTKTEIKINIDNKQQDIIILQTKSDIQTIIETNKIQIILANQIEYETSILALTGIITSYTQINGNIIIFNNDTLDIILKGYIDKINLYGLINSNINLKGFIENILLKGVLK